MGLFSKKAPQMNLGAMQEYQTLTKDIGAIRNLRDKEITGTRKSTDLALEQLDTDRMRSMGDIQAGGMGRFAAMQDTLSRQGGMDSGARERLAMNTGRDATMARQKAGADYGRMASDMTSQDYAAQEGLKEKAMFSLPQMSSIPLQHQLKATAANQQAKAQSKSGFSSLMGGVGKIAGGAMGSYFGPIGTQIGAAAGGGLFSSIF